MRDKPILSLSDDEEEEYKMCIDDEYEKENDFDRDIIKEVKTQDVDLEEADLNPETTDMSDPVKNTNKRRRKSKRKQMSKNLLKEF